MRLKTFFSLAALANLFYGVWYFLLPQAASNVYGFGDSMTPLSTTMLQFLGIMFLAEGVMCAVVRNADRSLGRTAVLVFIAVSSLLCFGMDLRTLMAAPGTMDYIDTVVNALFGFGALYFVVMDRETLG